MATQRITVFFAGIFVFSGSSLFSQGMAMPSGDSFSAAAPSTTPSSPAMPAQPPASPPSLSRTPAAVSRGVAGNGELPREAGQQYRTYDLTPYTGYLTNIERPHQAIVDWILRETGTDVWFTEPFGFINAKRDSLVVYHTPEMHAVVQDILDRFLAGTKDPQVLSLKILTVGNPNWRARANPLIQHVNVQSPGVQAWLVSKENNAMLMSLLRSRTDTRELQAADIVLHNGQSSTLGSTRSKNYVRSVRPNPNAWPPYEPETGQAQEGYQLEFSPLLATDGATIDVMMRCSIDQVEQLVPVDLDLPLPNGQNHRARIEVPQVVSWRLHERFRWPSDQVLLLSCGVVASPDRPANSLPLLNLDRFVGATPGRADALMILEWRGRTTENVISPPRTADAGTTVSRGRY